MCTSWHKRLQSRSGNAFAESNTDIPDGLNSEYEWNDMDETITSTMDYSKATHENKQSDIAVETNEAPYSEEDTIAFIGTIVKNTIDSDKSLILLKPMGDELPYEYVCLPEEEVKYHAPARGATHTCMHLSCESPISIHAPARGATCLLQINLLSQIFQSTLPRGERLVGIL